jgi:ribbon-helix-helix protein
MIMSRRTPTGWQDNAVAPEDRTARLTILIDPRKKLLFERLCAQEDATPSQVVRRLIRRYILEQTGQPWVPPEEAQRPARVRHKKRPRS